jgi:hypothetical protein
MGYEHLKGKALQEAKNEWIVANREIVRVGLNEIRNYTQGQLRDAVVNMMVSGEKVPTPEQLEMCALRDPKLNEKENQWIFDVYVDVFLFKIIGKVWDGNVRHYKTIGSAKVGSGKDAKPSISSGTEAFCVAVYKNYMKRWTYMAECRRRNVKYDRQNDEAKTDFVSTNQGQARWGGWTEAGRSYFMDLRNKIDKARAAKHVQKMEQDCLNRLRIAHKIVSADGKEAKKSSKKRKAHVMEEEVIDEGDEL